MGRIFDIQPYSVHDGPGIRTTVFLKGCPLNCKWCSNPEGIREKPQIRFFPDLCRTNCQRCLDQCKKQAIQKEKDRICLDFSKCDLCEEFSCTLLCYEKALRVCGHDTTVEKLAKKISLDRSFFGEDGGVTLSGGEPFFQPDFTNSVLREVKSYGISTVVETSMFAPFETIEKALPFIDFFIFDIKFFEEKKHLEYCGVSNNIILENIKKLTKIARIPLLPRLPIIPGVNDSAENINGIAAFLKGVGLSYINLLPFMKLGEGKFEQIGLKYHLKQIQALPSQSLQKVSQCFSEYNITCI
ncbi:MAG: glycyl-radical enzyme activating protein [Candidatus Riflebacteria bacterium]|nr:glycyl-radical enzyme activating protein [Candidatus Riflebacteria bacterium]